MTSAGPTTPDLPTDADQRQREELRRYRAIAAWAQLAMPEEYPAIVAKIAILGA